MSISFVDMLNMLDMPDGMWHNVQSSMSHQLERRHWDVQLYELTGFPNPYPALRLEHEYEGTNIDLHGLSLHTGYSLAIFARILRVSTRKSGAMFGLYTGTSTMA
jgi:hypothetical protein